MRVKFMFLSLLLSCIFSSVAIAQPLPQPFAQEYEYVDLGDLSIYSNERNGREFQDPEMGEAVAKIQSLPRKARVKQPTRSDVRFQDVTVLTAGSLASLLGNEINEIDSLVVRGPVNYVDIYTMWRSSFYGKLTVLNLENAEIQDNRLPRNAFWYQEEQYTLGSDIIEAINLRRIILPEGLEEIGEGAFAYAINLEEINFPSTLKEIQGHIFTDCVRLNVNPLVIPEGVEEIGYMAFNNCKSLTAKVVMPSTLKRIKGGAFVGSRITECNFPEGLEEIGECAFYANCLKEAILPNTCQSLPGAMHFMLNYELEKVSLPEGIKAIPVDFVADCFELKEFIMPNSVEVIGRSAFGQCTGLHELQLSTSLKSIDREGLYDCKGLTTINFPSSLETLGTQSCENWRSIESIYCEALIPPTCISSEINSEWTPFGSCSDDVDWGTRRDIPVYVPVGSAELYRNAWGWNFFTNFIEIDNFPYSGTESVSLDTSQQDDTIYDLFGRKVDTIVPGNIYIRNGKKHIK